MIGLLGISQECMKIHYDNQSSVHLDNHQLYQEKTKYINIYLHFIKYMIKFKEIIVRNMTWRESGEYVCQVIS